MSEEPRKIYEELGNGIVAVDAKYANKPLADFARKMRNAFLITGIVILVIFFFAVIVPWSFHFACNIITTVSPDAVVCRSW
jgi:hypothetical protein